MNDLSVGENYFTGTDQILNDLKKKCEAFAESSGIYENEQISDLTQTKDISKDSLCEVEKALKSP